MIRLARIRSGDRIPKAFFGKKRIERERALLTARRDRVLEFDSSQWKPAKETLKAEAHDKCAYCESKSSAAYPGDVEHLRPKDVHWWLAWAYENYAYACFLCNNKKSNQFEFDGKRWPAPRITAATTDAAIAKLAGTLTPDPLDLSAGLTQEAFERLHRAEDARLPNPYLDDVTAFLAWDADDVLKRVDVVPRGKGQRARRVVAALERICNLNRDDLAHDRYSHYWKLRAIARPVQLRLLPPALEAESRAGLETAMTPAEPYSAMARYFIEIVWKVK